MWDEEDDQGIYDASQICLNGHRITPDVHSRPEDCARNCKQCGEPTVSNCQHCSAEIRGTYRGRGVISCPSKEVPNYCHACGKPYPWLERKIEGIKACIDEMGSLPQTTRASLKEVASDLVVETPKTQAATMRYKNALEKIAKDGAESKEGAKLLASFITGIATFSVKESIKHWFGGLS
jgi:hypothetical protein